MSFEIERIHAREILDSRGNPTVEVAVTSCGFGRTTLMQDDGLSDEVSSDNRNSASLKSSSSSSCSYIPDLTDTGGSITCSGVPQNLISNGGITAEKSSMGDIAEGDDDRPP